MTTAAATKMTAAKRTPRHVGSPRRARQGVAMTAAKVKPWAVVMTQKEADALTARVAELEAALDTIAHAATVGGISAGERKGLERAAAVARAALKGAA